MRILAETVFRIGGVNLAEQLQCPFPRRRSIAGMMHADGFGKLAPDGEQWIEAGQPVLEDCNDVEVAQLALLGFG